MAQDRTTGTRGEASPRRGKHARHAAGSVPATSAYATRAASRPAQAPAPAARPVSAGRRPLPEHHAVGRSQLASVLPVITSSDEQDAPRPIGVDPEATGAFQRISAGQGATVETRENVSKVSPDSTASWSRKGLGAEMRLRGSRRPQVQDRSRDGEDDRSLGQQVKEHWIILVALVAVIVVGGFLLHGCLSSVQDTGTGDTGEVQQAQTSADGTVTYQGTVFSLAQRDDGSYVLQGHPASSSDNETYMEFTGEPVQLILYNGAIIIPENVDGGWDVLAYTIGSGSVGSQVVDANGNPVGGSGKISSVELHEKDLLVTDESGSVTRVSLE